MQGNQTTFTLSCFIPFPGHPEFPCDTTIIQTATLPTPAFSKCTSLYFTSRIVTTTNSLSLVASDLNERKIYLFLNVFCYKLLIELRHPTQGNPNSPWPHHESTALLLQTFPPKTEFADQATLTMMK